LESLKVGDNWESEPDLQQLRRAHGLLTTDPARALTDLKSLADRGSVMSMVYIADAYKNGIGTRVDLSQAREWYTRAGDLGSLLSIYELGRLCLDLKQYSDAKYAFERGAARGHMPSMNMLGKMYYNGLAGEKNFAKSRELFEKSAAMGHVFAKRNLGVLLLKGGFGPTQALRGVWLFLSALKDVPLLLYFDRLSNRLR
jgi:TPR repeat protein